MIDLVRVHKYLSFQFLLDIRHKKQPKRYLRYFLNYRVLYSRVKTVLASVSRSHYISIFTFSV